MSFFTQASFVMDPNVYGVGKLYVPKPTDGSGDLTFTRASNGTRVNQDGLIEKVRTNEIINSVWAGVGTNIAPTSWANGFTSGNYESASSSFSENTAIRFYGTAQRRYISQSPSFGGIMSFSFYVELVTITDEVRYVVSQIGGTDIMYLENGVPVSSSTSLSAGNYYTLVFDSSGATQIRLGGGVTTNRTYDFTLSIPQLETGDIATDYIATTSAAVSVGPVSGLPRLDYSGGASCPSLLLEPQRTNYLFPSENATSWSNGSSNVTANAAISPSGYQDADEITGTGDFYKITTLTNSDLASSTIFVKRKTADYFKMSFGSPNTQRVIFNLNTGVVHSTLGSVTGVAGVDYGNGWWRFEIRGYSAGSFAYAQHHSCTSTGTQVAGAYIWGAQVEAGAYATSYIPTLSSAVTRVADAASKTGISSLIGQTEGTIFLEIDEKSVADNRLVAISDTLSSASNYFIIQREGTNALQIRYLSGGSESVLATVSGFSQGKHKIAFAYKNSEFNVCVDGTSNLVTSTITMPTSLSTIQFSKHPLYSSVYYNAAINQALLFKTRLSNADLARLTSL